MYGTIAVGTDGSETATIAENVALQLATSSNGRVLFISAFTDGPSRRRSVEALERARARADAAGVPVDAEPVKGEPAAGVVEIADRRNAELLIVGDIGMGERHMLRLGGVPDRVSHEMPCDLLIVRTSKPERAKGPGEYASVLIATDGSPTADRAASEGHDLVVVGNKGMTGGLRFLLGVVPDKVSHQAPCDVLIVNTVGRSAADLEPGEGGIVELDGKRVAAYRDEQGALTVLSPRCKHMGCTVGWNHRAKTWDCPCHGSRYKADGTVKNGPTRHPLDPIST